MSQCIHSKDEILGRPAAKYRLDAKDHGVVLRHGDGPGRCDIRGARDVWVFEAEGIYYMHYDAAGRKGWLSALATSKDPIHWQKKGPVLELGKAGENDSASASYGTTFYNGSADAKMPVGVKSHMNRDIGLAWLKLPLMPPTEAR